MESIKEKKNSIIVFAELEKEIKKIIEVMNCNFANIKKIIGDLSNREKDNLLAEMLNCELRELKMKITIERYKQLTPEVENIIDYFMPDEMTIMEADNLADDLFFKVKTESERTITLPIDISHIKLYCIPANIKDNEIQDIILWIIVRYQTFLIVETIK